MIAIASDHAAAGLKAEIIGLLEEMGLEYKDYGPSEEDLEILNSDYPIYGRRGALAVASGECDRGILICGTGIGMSLTANKIEGIRCAVCGDTFSAEMSRLHNDANMIAIGARVLGAGLARAIVKKWLETNFEGGRHERRVNLIMDVEKGIDIESKIKGGSC